MRIIRWSMRIQCFCVLNPPHDSRDCARVISVSHCASDLYEAERVRYYGNLAEGVVSTRSKGLTTCSLVETE